MRKPATRAICFESSSARPISPWVAAVAESPEPAVRADRRVPVALAAVAADVVLAARAA